MALTVIYGFVYVIIEGDIEINRNGSQNNENS